MQQLPRPHHVLEHGPPLVSSLNSSERLMFRLRFKLSETHNLSLTLLRKVHVESPVAAVSVMFKMTNFSKTIICAEEMYFFFLAHNRTNAVHEGTDRSRKQPHWHVARCHCYYRTRFCYCFSSHCCYGSRFCYSCQSSSRRARTMY